MLTDLERNTIFAALQNGLGLTNPCAGLNKNVIEVSNFIKITPSFEMECRARITAGYQLILTTINDAAQKRTWEKWRTQRSYIDNFIVSLNTWECICKANQWSFANFTRAIRQCKTIPETSTAMGLKEADLWTKVYSEPGLAQWMLQNGYAI